MRLIQLVVPPDDAELAADRLWLAGAGAVEEISLGPSTVGVRSVLADDVAVSLDRLGDLPATWDVEWVEVADAASDAWRDFAVPIAIGTDLVLRPAWLPAVDDGRIEVAIEPGGSFGLGDHPTTRLSAAATVRSVRPGCSVLDVGCGSGVLAIVAALVGAARIVAIDIAEAAVEATQDNARRNEVAASIAVSSTLLAEVDDEFDVVLANVLAPTIVAMAADLRRVVAPGGVLVVSGVLAERHDHVVDALAPLRVVRTDVLESWAAIELRRPA